ncbi:PREDICTED: uncharacterized protein LOC105565773 [Vollenhovia emeryi]|uniref:uncharacterized protein LOC105565773 n=1 Tax=Vollenhovia emeryi TaxID=411798 RepID=UPI0005F545ED|nr:PREDICTED: uncharacterized protein LOC105565773 [Vollenhovia emeryi]
MNSENTNPGLLVASKGCSAKMENTNMHADSAVHVKSVLLHTLNLNEQSGINILHSSFTDLAETGNGAVEKVLENLNSNKISNDICQNNDCNVTTNRSHLHPASDTDVKTACPCDNNDTEQKDSSTEHHSPTTCILSGVRKVKENLLERVKAEECSPIPEEDLQSSLQIAKIIKEECLNLQRSADGDKSVTLNKTELTVLLSKLKNLICRLEEDVADFKLTLTTVTELLCATNVANVKSEDNKETEVAQQIIETTENLNDNTKVTDTMDSKLPLGRIDTERDNSSDETLKMLNIDDNFLEMNDKENEENLNSPLIKQCITSERRRRSARLMAKVLQNSNAVSDSFENLENELEIVNKKFNTPLKSRTPAKNKYQDKKVEGRPMKEYMALRSRMSCLSTPNTKRLNFSKSTNNIDYEANNSNTSVSNKVFAELYSLYEDSV